MDGLGLPYRAVAPGVDEVVAPGTSTQQAVALLAERKARAVFAKHPRALVIGSD
ncbi:MAG TPA: Maf family protein, partial [Archangium sp.]